jgi:O-antigen/teichoic acid export membrane protein
LAAFVLFYFKDERLIYYSVFILFVTFGLAVTSKIFVLKKYKNLVSGKLLYDKPLMKEMSTFAGWNMIGVFAGIGYNNGVNILLNMFFGITVNAARAIVFQVQNAVNTVVTNLQIAFSPNIIQKYAENDKKEYLKFFYISTKLSFIIIMVMAIFLYLNLNQILVFWLKDVPENTDLYLKIVLIDVLIAALVGPLHTLIQASGKVRTYQIIISGILLLNLPLSYLLIKSNYGAEITFIVALLLNFLSYFLRLLLLKRLIQFNVMVYLRTIVIPAILCLGILFISRSVLIDSDNLLLTFYMLVIFMICAFVLFFNLKDIKAIFSVIKRDKS